MRLAEETLKAINAAIEIDQGAKYRGLLRQLMPLAEDAYRDEEEDFRDHLGASVIGDNCARAVWYKWRWVKRMKFSGQLLRLFNRGHLEEPRMLALLMLIGCKVWHQDANGKQYRIYGYKGHYGGGMDGVGQGIPELPANTPFLLEFKTHNLKSFTKLQEFGVLKSKWGHFVQMQQYMASNRLSFALYGAVCKDNDHLHLEIVEFDQTQFDRYTGRAKMIIDSEEAPPRINNSPSWYICKFCDFKEVCHGAEPVARNCRTCKYVQAVDDGQWVCHNEVMNFPPSDRLIYRSPYEQRQGCPNYCLNQSIKK